MIMVLVQAIFAVVNIGYKLAANDGMRLPVLVAYRFMFGAAFIVPVSFFVERLNFFSFYSSLICIVQEDL